MTFTIRAVQPLAVIARFLPAAFGLTACGVMAAATSALAQGSLFTTVPVDESKFILVSAPIGSGERSQLNIYEQRSDKRTCFAVAGGSPAVVDPLLSTFDFTGICSRYIDGNGYSLRIGGDDLGTRYRLTVVNTGKDMELRAAPTRDRSQPVMLVAKTGGPGSGFLKFNLEPGWRLVRRAYGKKALGHIYVYRDAQAVQQPAESDTSTVQPSEDSTEDSTASQE